MEKLILILIWIFCVSVSFSQSCLPEGIILSNQAQIDSFQINYPGCQRIEGNVKIEGHDIRNLNGLSQLREFGAHLFIHNCDSLIRLTGLDSVTHVGGGLSISGNSILRTLNGINSLDTIGGSFILSDNEWLENISALENLTRIGSSIRIHSNLRLKNLDGLDSVKSCVNYIYINYNYSLENIHGLRGINGTRAYIKVEGNPRLKNLEGLEGIKTIWDELIIYQNDSLISLKGLDNVDSVIGDVKITLNKQLVTLDAMKQLRQVGRIYITFNDKLRELNGFNSLTLITGDCLFFSNPAMVSLEGLNNLRSIEGNLLICDGGYTNLDALASLDSIGWFGYFCITGNSALYDISGIENISTNSIKELVIKDNPLLSVCDVKNICAYLAGPVEEVEIHDNGIGCNSIQEVEEACKMDLEEYGSLASSLLIYPNPASEYVTIELSDSLLQHHITTWSIFNTHGQGIIEKINPLSRTVLNISEWNAGIYLLKADGQDMIVVKKFVVE